MIYDVLHVDIKYCFEIEIMKRGGSCLIIKSKDFVDKAGTHLFFKIPMAEIMKLEDKIKA